MRRLFAAAAVLAVALTGFTAPSGADPLPPGPRNLEITTPGPTVGGCTTATQARIIVPAGITVQDIAKKPFWLSAGVQAGSLTVPCTVGHQEIAVSTELWFLPLLGPAQLVAVGGGHGNCQGSTAHAGEGCTRAQSFQTYVGVPGIYQIRGYVQFKDNGVFGPVTSFDGQRFLYDVYSIEPI